MAATTGISSTTDQGTGIFLSEAAAAEIKNLAAEAELDLEKVHLRVGVKGGGCSGFSYVLDLTDSRLPHDEMFERHGIRIVCDPKSLLYLGGTTIEYRDEGLNSRGFVFQNPNASTSCGCGSSFSV